MLPFGQPTDWDCSAKGGEGGKSSHRGRATFAACARDRWNSQRRRELVVLGSKSPPIANGAKGGAPSSSFVGRRNTDPRAASIVELGLFGAVGDPEEVVEFLRVSRGGVIGPFVFVFNVGAGGLHGFSGFTGGVGGAAVDGAAGGFGEIGGGEGQWNGEGSCTGGKQKYAEHICLHSVLGRKIRPTPKS